MKRKSFVQAVTWTAAVLFSGAVAKPVQGSPPLQELNKDGPQVKRAPQEDLTIITPPSQETTTIMWKPTTIVTTPVVTVSAGPPTQETGRLFEWTVIGDSWSSGVAYSPGTLYALSDREYCYRSNQAYGAMMERNGGSWIDGEQQFEFVACGGTKMNDINRQLGRSGRPQLALGTFGGNDGHFGDIARACIYQPAPGGWGPDYDNDPDGEGWCKRYLAQAREFIDNPAGLADTFDSTIDQIFDFSQREDQYRSRFDLYVSSYVKFFNDETDECDNWTFARWFSTGSPRLVKALRKEMNDLVGKFNDVQSTVINGWRNPTPIRGVFNARYVPISDRFEGRRFCEPHHSFEDQWYSADVWLWNLSWKNGDLGNTTLTPRRQMSNDTLESEQDEDVTMNLRFTDDNGVTRMGKPPNALDGPFPVLSLFTTERNSLDDQYLPLGPGTGGDNVTVALQSGFGWTARPFHPKPLGNKAMMDAYIAAFRADGLPGVKG